MTDRIEALQAVLNPAINGEAYYAINTNELNENTVFPYLTFLEITSNTNNTLDGATDLQNSRFQIDVYSDRLATLVSASNAVMAAMAAAPFTNVRLTSQDTYEDQVRLYRRSMDFSVWSTN